MTNIDEIYRKAQLLKHSLTYEKWRHFNPATKQREFLAAGAATYERLLMAGNGCGKTETGAYEVNCHLTGEYPEWWQGYRYEGPVIAWIAGETAVDVRDTSQEKLFGPPGDPSKMGTGLIPQAAILGQPSASRSAPNAYESALVKHRSGGTSRIVFKTYAQKVSDWQGPTIQLIWFDEECPYDLHAEGMARLRGKGRAISTYTPTKGMTPLTKEFMDSENRAQKLLVMMGLKDCPWYTPEQVERMVLSYPLHEREARINGTPMLGSGNVFQVPLDDMLEEPIPFDRIPEHWCLIWGLDFGIDHPFAAVLMAWDKDTDTLHVLHEVRMSGALPLQHADPMKRIGGEVPVAWPHDGHVREKSSGVALADIYKANGLRMMPSHATHPDGGFSFYAGITGLHEYMRGGRFKVSRLCTKWCDEYRMYHYKDGQVVKVNDDLMSATRVGWMERRSAKDVRLGPSADKRKRPSFVIRPDADVWESPVHNFGGR